MDNDIEGVLPPAKQQLLASQPNIFEHILVPLTLKKLFIDAFEVNHLLISATDVVPKHQLG